jgi:hypothetical protein
LETITTDEHEEVEEASYNSNRHTSSLVHTDRNSFGYVRLYVVKDCKEGERPAKEAVPRVALYHNRGQELCHLNRYEYNALIQVKEKPKNETACSSLCFDFSNTFVLAARYTQQLKAKQPTMIFKGKPPPHPGQRPEKITLVSNWQKRADKYANYILTMFRPEIDNERDYSWNALESWIKNLQDDNFIISKFRLMTIDNRLQALNATFQQKVIVSDYRFRNHDKWTDYQHQQFDREDHLAQIERMNDQSVLPDDEFSEANDMLSPRIEKQVRQILMDDSKFSASIAKVRYSCIDGCTSTTSGSFPQQDTQNIIFGHDVDWFEMSIHVYDETNTGTEIQENSTSSLVPRVQTGEGSVIEELSLNHGQTQIFEIYKKYLMDPSDEKNTPPPSVVLVTGKGGTGKSHLINALMEHGINCGNRPLGTAFNNLNAADIGGITISKLLSEGIQPKKNKGGSNSEGIARPIKLRAIQTFLC